MSQKIYRFIVRGNQEDSNGNPIPYLRSTQKSQWLPKVVRYNEWKTYVQNAFLKEYDLPLGLSQKEQLKTRKVIGLTDKCRVRTAIFFRTEAHADPDNIVKGILDALFVNDKHVDVTTDHYCHSDSPRVEVTIEI